MDYDKLAGNLGGEAATDIDYDHIASKVGGGDASVTDKLLHQAGLTGRHIIEGAADTVGLFSDPVAALMNAGGANVTTAHNVGASVADNLGLPHQENATERVVGDASRLLVGTGGLIKGAASAASRVANPAVQSVLQASAANPGLQAASSVGAGAGGGIARENGAGAGGQLAASIAGGLTGAGLAAGAKSSLNIIKNFMNKPTPQQVDKVINQAGISLGSYSNDVQNSIRKDVEAALKTDGEVSPDALRRLADYRAVQATPTRGSLTLNPADVTRDRNMAKVSANSSDPAAQTLANVANDNNKQLITGLNKLGAETAPDKVTAGNALIESLKTKDAQAKGIIDGLYSDARATDGRSALIDPHAFTQKANDLLDNSLLGGKISSDVRNKLNAIATGKTPLTVDVAEQFKTNIAQLQRASTDPAERLALGHIRSALDDAPLLEGQGQAAIDAFGKARSANKAYMNVVDNTPALKAVRDGIEPDKFVDTFIIGNGSKSNISDVEALKKAVGSDPDALQTIRDQIVAHLKNKALNGASDEVANFSPATYNKAVKDIGDLKLSMFFDKGDIDMLKTLGRVASYEKFQPSGSAVNNSNTAATFTALLDKIANSPLVRKIPLGGEIVANPAKNVSIGIGARKSLDAAKGITNKPAVVKQPALPLSALLIPGSLTKDQGN
jgi:hypothetical protein